MALSVNLRKLLHRKSPEICNPLLINTTAGGFVASTKCSDQDTSNNNSYYVSSASAIYKYNPENDGWIQIPASGIAGAFGAGSCGESRAISAMGGVQTQTATAGTTTTITTNRTIVTNLKDVPVKVVGGTGAGYAGTISSNTIGANSVLTVTPANGVAFDNTTQYSIYAGSLWFFNAGTTAVGFRVYDYATNAWTAKSVTGLPTAWGTDGQLCSTESFKCGPTFEGYVNGTSTGTNTSTTLNDTTLTLPTNGWANSQVRIVSGTGAGQIRTISSNTATQLTVSSAWTITPDATSVYRIEANDDFIYLLGNNAVTLYKYTISTDTWATMSPVAARSGAMAAGGMCVFVDTVSDTKWTNGTYATLTTGILKQNGRYLYSFRGGAASTLDVYNLASNTWVSNISYGNQTETFTAGSNSVVDSGMIYLQKEATGRIFKFDVGNNVLLPYTLNYIPQGTAVAGNKMFCQRYTEGANSVTYLYSLANTRSELVRWVMI